MSRAPANQEKNHRLKSVENLKNRDLKVEKKLTKKVKNFKTLQKHSKEVVRAFGMPKQAQKRF